MSDTLDIIWLVVFAAFAIYMILGTRKLSRYEDPEYQRRQDEMQRRTVEAAERQAAAIEKIARSLR